MTTETFAALPPLPTGILIGGESLEITPLKVGELPAFARAVRPLAAKLGPNPDWLRLLSEEGESVIAAVAIACRRPPNWVAALALDEAIRLLEAVFEANADFFIHRVVPQIMRVSQTLANLSPGLTPGVTQSSGSCEAGTATATS